MNVKHSSIKPSEAGQSGRRARYQQRASHVYSWKEAFVNALEAARFGKPRYQTFVGYCYDFGRGVQRNRKLARQWYERAARNGQIDAIFNLAVFNDEGIGMRRNARRAAKLYQQAAMRGDLEAQANIAVMLLEGDGVKRNIRAGLRWLRRAAQRGDSRAQYNLGRAYMYGEAGLGKSTNLSEKWLRKAATAGHKQAARLLRSGQKG